MLYYGDINNNALIMSEISQIILVGCIAFQFTLVSCNSSNEINCPAPIKYIAEGDKEGEIYAWTCMIDRSPNDFFGSMYMRRGILRSEVGNKYGAVDDFNIAIDKQMISISRLIEDAKKKGISENNDEIWKMKKDVGETYYRRAVVKSDLGDKSGAINDFQSAAQVYSSIGNTEWYQKSLQAVEMAKNR